MMSIGQVDDVVPVRVAGVRAVRPRQVYVNSSAAIKARPSSTPPNGYEESQKASGSSIEWPAGMVKMEVKFVPAIGDVGGRSAGS
jgi:hypothetical protein